MKETNLNNEMVSLNSEFSEFSLQRLEERLETDPLAIGGLLNMTSSTDNIESAYLVNDCVDFTCGFIYF